MQSRNKEKYNIKIEDVDVRGSPKTLIYVHQTVRPCDIFN